MNCVDAVPGTPALEAELALFAIAQPETMALFANLRDSGRTRGYCVEPPVATEDIMAFEAFFEVALPMAYRCFLQVAGNGLKDSDGSVVVAGIPAKRELDAAGWGNERELLSRPSPLTEEREDYPSYYDITYIEEDEAELLDETAPEDDGASEADCYENGCWVLCERESVFLVVKGEQAGRVWRVPSEFGLNDDELYETYVMPEGEFADWLRESL